MGSRQIGFSPLKGPDFVGGVGDATIPPRGGWTAWADSEEYVSPFGAADYLDGLHQATTNVTPSSPTFYGRYVPIQSGSLAAGWSSPDATDNPPMFHGWVNGWMHAQQYDVAAILASALPAKEGMIDWPEGAVGVEFEPGDPVVAGARFRLSESALPADTQRHVRVAIHSYGWNDTSAWTRYGAQPLQREWYVLDAPPVLPAAADLTLPRDAPLDGEYHVHSHWFPYRDALLGRTPDLTHAIGSSGIRYVDSPPLTGSTVALCTVLAGGLDYEVPLLGMPDWSVEAPKATNSPLSVVAGLSAADQVWLEAFFTAQPAIALRVSLPRHRFFMRDPGA